MLLEIIILTITVIFFFNWWCHNFWNRRNVFSLPTEFFFGNVKQIMLQRTTMPTMFTEIYKKHKKQKIIGFYSFYNPMLFITDPEIIKRVLVTDFNSFSDNGFVLDRTVDPLFALNPFIAKGIPQWKELRSIQAALQTSLKLKEYLPGIVKVADSMNTYIQMQRDQPILVKDLTTRLAVGSAVLTGYGVEPNSFTDPEFSFMKYASGDKLFSTNSLSSFVPFFIPMLSKLLSLRIVSKETEDFFISMVKTNIEHRHASNISRGDLIDTLIKLNEKKLEQNTSAYTITEMAAHCATFYLDATVTTSEVLNFLMLELANRQEVQEKLREEILSVGKNPEDLNYDKIHSLTYFQMFFDECMRFHAPVSTISRICTKDVTIDDVNIPKGTKVFISPYALHCDPEYYAEPEKFKPERFSEENKQSMVKYTFLPFGDGPRICVGMKYASLVVKLTIASILLKFRVLSTNDQKEIMHNPAGAFIVTPPPDATLKFEEL